MSQPPDSDSNATQSPIAKLPPELLTEVLSHVALFSPRMRLVCRGFKECSWAAFGARIGRTTFDFRSVESMEHLKAISEHSTLASHVTRLEFGTGFISGDWPEVGFLEGSGDEVEVKDHFTFDVLEDMKAARNGTSYWFADAWNWTPCMVHAVETLQLYATDIQKQLVAEFLAQTLSKFKNLNGIKYLEDHIPTCLRSVYCAIQEQAEEKGIYILDPPSSERVAMDILGVDIMLQSLAEGNVVVKSLNLPLPALYCHAITTYTSPLVFKKILLNVETLEAQLPNIEPFRHHLGPGQEVMLTSCTAPRLQSLRWENWNQLEEVPHTWLNQIPIPADTLPPLRLLQFPSYLEWTTGGPMDDNFFAFLSGVGSTLKDLIFKASKGVDWVQLIKFLATSQDISLERLELDIASARDGLGDFLKDQEIPEKEIFNAAASTVVLKNMHLKEWLEKKWAPKKPVGGKTAAKASGK